MEKVKIQAEIKAPVDVVWQLWTSPKHIVKWNTASEDWHTTRAENDVRVGGRFLSRMEAKDGSFGFDFSGVYTGVEECVRLAYTLDDGRQVEVSFASTAGGVSVNSVFEAEQENPVEMQRDGWQAILNNFKAYAEDADNQ